MFLARLITRAETGKAEVVSDAWQVRTCWDSGVSTVGSSVGNRPPAAGPRLADRVINWASVPADGAICGHQPDAEAPESTREGITPTEEEEEEEEAQLIPHPFITALLFLRPRARPV